MKRSLQMFQVDAFASSVFSGNPAAIVPLKNWLSDIEMQNIAMENNLSETAFFVQENDDFNIRWFTPAAEVDLCGHATLASAHVIYNHLNYKKEAIIFHSKSGMLKVEKKDDLLILDFPTSEVNEVPLPESVISAMNVKPQKCFKGRDDLMLIFNSEKEISNLNPNFQKLLESKTRGIICTANSNSFDFVSRFFAPAVGVNEDPVTGSAHTMLIPFWAKLLGKNKLTAKQISKRGGILHCEHLGSRVKIGGSAITYLIGEIFIEQASQ